MAAILGLNRSNVSLSFGREFYRFTQSGTEFLLPEKDHCGGVLSLRVTSSEQSEDTNAAARRISSVQSTIAILRYLAAVREPTGVNAIARQLRLTPSSCFNILKTLVAESLVDFDAKNKKYSLGDGLVAIARHALDPNAAFEIIRGRAEKLADSWGITIGLWRVVREERIVLIGFAVGATTMRIHMMIGQRLPSLIGAAGRCIAAANGLTTRELEEQFPTLNWQEPPSFERYAADVERARELGWGVDRGNFIRGATSLATTIISKDGRVRYCLTATMFTGQHPEGKFTVLAREMRDIASWASTQLNYPG